MSIPLHWRRGDACDVRGVRGKVLDVLQDDRVLVDLGNGRAANVSREMLDLVPYEPPVSRDEVP